MKILVIHASAGAGHLKAAEAVTAGIQAHTQYEVELVDALDFASVFYKRLYQKSYLFLISKVPIIWALCFALMDIPLLQPVIRLARRFYNNLNMKRLQRHLINEQFHYIISTHFMPTEIAAALKRRGMIASHVITCVTDFDVHRIWLAEGVDIFTVASDWTKEKLKSMGVDGDIVRVTGIPTHEKFCGPFDKGALKAQLELKPDMFTVLIATGSFGIGPIEEIIQALKDVQVIVVCGYGKVLYERLSVKKYDNVKVCGLVDNMHELMAVADVMITKPGGLSISEALVSELPMIFFSAIPGQEENNVKVLKESDVGISRCGIAEIAQQLEHYKSSPQDFQAAVEKARALGRPHAVRDILSLIK